MFRRSKFVAVGVSCVAASVVAAVGAVGVSPATAEPAPPQAATVVNLEGDFHAPPLSPVAAVQAARNAGEDVDFGFVAKPGWMFFSTDPSLTWLPVGADNPPPDANFRLYAPDGSVVFTTNVKAGDHSVDSPFSVMEKFAEGRLTQGKYFAELRSGDTVVDSTVVNVRTRWSTLAYAAATRNFMDAGFDRCSTQRWWWDETTVPGKTAGDPKKEFLQVLDEVEVLTGLTFVKARNASDATMLGEYGPGRGAAGWGGWRYNDNGERVGYITLANDSEWGVENPWVELPRITLIRHEVGHALGLGHTGGVQQDTIMFPISVVGAAPTDWTGGEKDGFDTIYRPASCNTEPPTVVDPPDVPETDAPTIVITGQRATVGGKRGFVVSGATSNLDAGTVLRAWVRFAGQSQFAAAKATRVVDESETFTWQRKAKKRAYVYFAVDGAEVSSNRVRIP